MKRPHAWTYEEGYTDDEGFSAGDGALYCLFCFHWRQCEVEPDGSLGTYIPEEDEPECPVSRA